MSSTSETPKHLWIVGALSLLWNSTGAHGYYVTQTKNEEYLEAWTPEQLEFMYAYPAWMVSCWALAVFGGVLASILLLLRKKLALPVYGLSFVCMAVFTLRNYGLADGLEVMGTTAFVFALVIFAVALLLLVYSKKMADKGVLG